MDIDKQKIRELFEHLSEPMQDIVYSPETEEGILEIGRKYNLHVDQLGKLVDEVDYVLIGLNPIDSIEKNIAEKVGTDPVTTKSIVSEINESVFRRVRESLIEEADKNKEEKVSLEEEDHQIFNEAGIEIDVKQNQHGDTDHNEPSLNKDDILNGIEKVYGNENSAAPTITPIVTDITAQKMSGAFKIPSETKEVAEKAIEQPAKPRFDPYREIMN